MYPPFTPAGTPLTIDATTSSSQAALPTRGAAKQCLVTNSSGVTVAYIAFGTDSSVTATATGSTRSLMLAIGSSQVFTVPDGVTNVAAIMPSGASTTSIQFCWGYGQ